MRPTLHDALLGEHLLARHRESLTNLEQESAGAILAAFRFGAMPAIRGRLNPAEVDLREITRLRHAVGRVCEHHKVLV